MVRKNRCAGRMARDPANAGFASFALCEANSTRMALLRLFGSLAFPHPDGAVGFADPEHQGGGHDYGR